MTWESSTCIFYESNSTRTDCIYLIDLLNPVIWFIIWLKVKAYFNCPWLVQRNYAPSIVPDCLWEISLVFDDVEVNNIGFPAHFRHLFIQFHQFSIQFRPKKLTAFKSKVQFRQIVIHIRFSSIKFNNSAFKFVNCDWNSSLSLSELQMQGSNSSFFQTNSLFCHSNSSGVIGRLHLGDDFDWNFDENEMPIDEIAFAVSCSATVTDEFE